ncbi:Crp/Fnr family transcriptional regulator [Galbibacter mesophilus]|uniref:Crp/Fnr family transcriptional regulator n=1 Tax=Galbibacter mesophilus TaxID=379069 RepID=UPI00191D1481|nr:Crp/Fnr family transcriptional regulator [Galbibacter mesophilus]MCM5663452.1 Crp/Fnr family transcriptional regulator [Galbibacter mesophilus]
MIRKNANLLHYITKHLLQHSEGTIESCQYAPRTVVLGQKKRVSSVFIIKSGLAKCYLTEDNGVEFIQEFFGEGEIFGELEAINEKLSFCCIEAVNTLEVYKIETTYFKELLETDTTFNSLILKALANKLNYTAVRHAYNQSHTLEDNVKRLMEHYPNLIQEIAKQDIANYLGINVRSLHRVLKTIAQD